MIVVGGGVHVHEGLKDAAIAACREMEVPTQAETGCISYKFYIGITDPNYLHVFEEWESDEALDAHIRAPHTQLFLGKLAECAAEAPIVTKYVVTSQVALLSSLIMKQNGK